MTSSIPNANHKHCRRLLLSLLDTVRLQCGQRAENSRNEAKRSQRAKWRNLGWIKLNLAHLDHLTYNLTRIATMSFAAYRASKCFRMFQVSSLQFCHGCLKMLVTLVDLDMILLRLWNRSVLEEWLGGLDKNFSAWKKVGSENQKKTLGSLGFKKFQETSRTSDHELK